MLKYQNMLQMLKIDLYNISIKVINIVINYMITKSLWRLSLKARQLVAIPWGRSGRVPRGWRIINTVNVIRIAANIIWSAPTIADKIVRIPDWFINDDSIHDRIRNHGRIIDAQIRILFHPTS